LFSINYGFQYFKLSFFSADEFCYPKKQNFSLEKNPITGMVVALEWKLADWRFDEASWIGSDTVSNEPSSVLVMIGKYQSDTFSISLMQMEILVLHILQLLI
jgi:hypothetical protein